MKRSKNLMIRPASHSPFSLWWILYPTKWHTNRSMTPKSCLGDSYTRTRSLARSFLCPHAPPSDRWRAMHRWGLGGASEFLLLRRIIPTLSSSAVHRSFWGTTYAGSCPHVSWQGSARASKVLPARCKAKRALNVAQLLQVLRRPVTMVGTRLGWTNIAVARSKVFVLAATATH